MARRRQAKVYITEVNINRQPPLARAREVVSGGSLTISLDISNGQIPQVGEIWWVQNLGTRWALYARVGTEQGGPDAVGTVSSSALDLFFQVKEEATTLSYYPLVKFNSAKISGNLSGVSNYIISWTKCTKNGKAITNEKAQQYTWNPNEATDGTDDFVDVGPEETFDYAVEIPFKIDNPKTSYYKARIRAVSRTEATKGPWSDWTDPKIPLRNSLSGPPQVEDVALEFGIRETDAGKLDYRAIVRFKDIGYWDIPGYDFEDDVQSYDVQLQPLEKLVKTYGILQDSINSTDLTLLVKEVSGSGLPTSLSESFEIQIGNEIIGISSRTGNSTARTYIVETRGKYSTIAVNHNADVAVKEYMEYDPTAEDFIDHLIPVDPEAFPALREIIKNKDQNDKVDKDPDNTIRSWPRLSKLNQDITAADTVFDAEIINPKLIKNLPLSPSPFSASPYLFKIAIKQEVMGVTAWSYDADIMTLEVDRAIESTDAESYSIGAKLLINSWISIGYLQNDMGEDSDTITIVEDRILNFDSNNDGTEDSYTIRIGNEKLQVYSRSLKDTFELDGTNYYVYEYEVYRGIQNTEPSEHIGGVVSPIEIDLGYYYAVTFETIPRPKYLYWRARVRAQDRFNRFGEWSDWTAPQKASDYEDILAPAPTGVSINFNRRHRNRGWSLNARVAWDKVSYEIPGGDTADDVKGYQSRLFASDGSKLFEPIDSTQTTINVYEPDKTNNTQRQLGEDGIGYILLTVYDVDSDSNKYEMMYVTDSQLAETGDYYEYTVARGVMGTTALDFDVNWSSNDETTPTLIFTFPSAFEATKLVNSNEQEVLEPAGGLRYSQNFGPVRRQYWYLAQVRTIGTSNLVGPWSAPSDPATASDNVRPPQPFNIDVIPYNNYVKVDWDVLSEPGVIVPNISADTNGELNPDDFEIISSDVSYFKVQLWSEDPHAEAPDEQQAFGLSGNPSYASATTTLTLNLDQSYTAPTIAIGDKVIVRGCWPNIINGEHSVTGTASTSISISVNLAAFAGKNPYQIDGMVYKKGSVQALDLYRQYPIHFFRKQDINDLTQLKLAEKGDVCQIVNSGLDNGFYELTKKDYSTSTNWKKITKKKIQIPGLLFYDRYVNLTNRNVPVKKLPNKVWARVCSVDEAGNQSEWISAGPFSTEFIPGPDWVLTSIKHRQNSQLDAKVKWAEIISPDFNIGSYNIELQGGRLYAQIFNDSMDFWGLDPNQDIVLGMLSFPVTVDASTSSIDLNVTEFGDPVDVNEFIKIGNEIFRVVERNASDDLNGFIDAVYTVERGAIGTLPAAHNTGDLLIKVQSEAVIVREILNPVSNSSITENTSFDIVIGNEKMKVLDRVPYSESEYSVTLSGTSPTFNPLGTWSTANTDVIGTIGNGSSSQTGSSSFIFSDLGTASVWIAATSTGIWTSSNLTTWTQRNNTTNLRSLGYADGVWVAVGDGGKILTTSDPTSNWTLNTSNPFDSNDIYSVKYGNGIWVIAGANNSLAFTSNPKMTWTLVDTSVLPEDILNINSITYGAGYWVAACDAGVLAVVSTTAGISKIIETATTEKLNSVVYANGYWVAVGNNGTLLTAINPTETWTQRTINISNSALTNNFFEVAFGQGKWLISGSSGKLITAVDPTSDWSLITTGTTKNLYSVFFTPNASDKQWISAGTDGLILNAPRVTLDDKIEAGNIWVYLVLRDRTWGSNLGQREDFEHPDLTPIFDSLTYRTATRNGAIEADRDNNDYWDYTFENIAASSFYRARVQGALRSGVKGSWSNYTLWANPNDLTAPAAPEVIADFDAQVLNVSWTMPEDLTTQVFRVKDQEEMLALDRVKVGDIAVYLDGNTVLAFRLVTLPDPGEDTTLANWAATIAPIDSQGNTIDINSDYLYKAEAAAFYQVQISRIPKKWEKVGSLGRLLKGMESFDGQYTITIDPGQKLKKYPKANAKIKIDNEIMTIVDDPINPTSIEDWSKPKVLLRVERPTVAHFAHSRGDVVQWVKSSGNEFFDPINPFAYKWLWQDERFVTEMSRSYTADHIKQYLFEVRVRAADAAGNFSEWTVVPVSPSGVPNPNVTGLEFTDVDNTPDTLEAVLTFEGSMDANENISSFVAELMPARQMRILNKLTSTSTKIFVRRKQRVLDPVEVGTYTAYLEDEAVNVTARTAVVFKGIPAYKLTITRGFNSTLAAAHAKGEWLQWFYHFDTKELIQGASYNPSLDATVEVDAGVIISEDPPLGEYKTVFGGIKAGRWYQGRAKAVTDDERNSAWSDWSDILRAAKGVDSNPGEGEDPIVPGVPNPVRNLTLDVDQQKIHVFWVEPKPFEGEGDQDSLVVQSITRVSDSNFASVTTESEHGFATEQTIVVEKTVELIDNGDWINLPSHGLMESQEIQFVSINSNNNDFDLFTPYYVYNPDSELDKFQLVTFNNPTSPISITGNYSAQINYNEIEADADIVTISGAFAPFNGTFTISEIISNFTFKIPVEFDDNDPTVYPLVDSMGEEEGGQGDANNTAVVTLASDEENSTLDNTFEIDHYEVSIKSSKKVNNIIVPDWGDVEAGTVTQGWKTDNNVKTTSKTFKLQSPTSNLPYYTRVIAVSPDGRKSEARYAKNSKLKPPRPTIDSVTISPARHGSRYIAKIKLLQDRVVTDKEITRYTVEYFWSSNKDIDPANADSILQKNFSAEKVREGKKIKIGHLPSRKYLFVRIASVNSVGQPSTWTSWRRKKIVSATS